MSLDVHACMKRAREELRAWAKAWPARTTTEHFIYANEMMKIACETIEEIVGIDDAIEMLEASLADLKVTRAKRKASS